MKLCQSICRQKAKITIMQPVTVDYLLDTVKTSA